MINKISSSRDGFSKMVISVPSKDWIKQHAIKHNDENNKDNNLNNKLIHQDNRCWETYFSNGINTTMRVKNKGKV